MPTGDASWPPLVAAGVRFDPEKVEIRIGKLVVARKGRGLLFSEERALEILKRDEVEILIDLHQGEAKTTAWTCDLIEDYIRINADYRS